MNNQIAVEDFEVQLLVTKLQNHISDNYYNCSNEILLNLGMMYESDPHFKASIDKNSLNTASYVNKAIQVYCKNCN